MNKSFTIGHQYIKHAKIDNPGILHVISKKQESGENPANFKVDVQVKAGELNNFKIYEVILMIQAKATQEDKLLFELNLHYAALVHIESTDESVIKRILLVHIPTYLFPVARHLVSTYTRDSGYPPLELQIVDFEDLYDKKHADGIETQQ